MYDVYNKHHKEEKRLILLCRRLRNVTLRDNRDKRVQNSHLQIALENKQTDKITKFKKGQK